MPHRNIYVRVGDVAKWDALPNKAGWIHEKLNSDPVKELKQVLSKPAEKPLQVNPKSHNYTPEPEYVEPDDNPVYMDNL